MQRKNHSKNSYKREKIARFISISHCIRGGSGHCEYNYILWVIEDLSIFGY